MILTSKYSSHARFVRCLGGVVHVDQGVGMAGMETLGEGVLADAGKGGGDDVLVPGASIVSVKERAILPCLDN